MDLGSFFENLLGTTIIKYRRDPFVHPSWSLGSLMLTVAQNQRKHVETVAQLQAQPVQEIGKQRRGGRHGVRALVAFGA